MSLADPGVGLWAAIQESGGRARLTAEAIAPRQAPPGVTACRHTKTVTQASDPVSPPAGMRRFLLHPRGRWPTEVGDFTPWLAANLDLLAACLGGPLTLAGREVPLGPEGLRADLLARDGAGDLVVIEAQMGRTDARHLGQLVTYAAADAVASLIWVVADLSGEQSVRTEHIRALAWLNAACAASRVRFAAVEASVESDWYPAGTEREDAELQARLRLVDLHRPGLCASRRPAHPPLVVRQPCGEVVSILAPLDGRRHADSAAE